MMLNASDAVRLIKSGRVLHAPIGFASILTTLDGSFVDTVNSSIWYALNMQLDQLGFKIFPIINMLGEERECMAHPACTPALMEAYSLAVYGALLLKVKSK